jgi:hypothetical protein
MRTTWKVRVLTSALLGVVTLGVVPFLWGEKMSMVPVVFWDRAQYDRCAEGQQSKGAHPQPVSFPVPAFLERSLEITPFLHWLLLPAPTTFRHNHVALRHGKHEILLVGGRSTPSIDVYNMSSGTTELLFEGNVLLNVSHMPGIWLGNELYIPCGLNGPLWNEETMTHMIVVRRSRAGEWTVRQGPRLPIPSAGCDAVKINHTSFCIFGGHRGPHEAATFSNKAYCFNVARQAFTSLPEMPFAADHLNVVLVQPRTCHRDDPARFLVMNYRTEGGSVETPIMALDMVRSHALTGKTWSIYLPASAPYFAPHRDAACTALVDDGRLVFVFGGICGLRDNCNFATLKHISREVRAFDVCAREWIPDIATLRVPRAASACTQDKKFIYVSGGGAANGAAIGLRARNNNPKYPVEEGASVREVEIFSIPNLVALARARQHQLRS